MRVIAGEAKGRKLVSPKTKAVRPTSDRAREAIFDVLEHLGAIKGARVADLFAGTGALGIEALSRGARRVTFVDNEADSVSLINANLERTGFQGRAEVLRTDAISWCRRGHRVEVAFADPPYEFGDWETLLAVLPADLAVLESKAEISLRSPWSLHRRYRHGGTLVTVAVKPLAEPPAESEAGP